MHNNFAECRRKAGLTQASVAKALGKTQAVISNWERGRFKPRVSDLYRLIQLYGCTWNELMGPAPDGPEAEERPWTYQDARTSAP